MRQRRYTSLRGAMPVHRPADNPATQQEALWRAGAVKKRAAPIFEYKKKDFAWSEPSLLYTFDAADDLVGLDLGGRRVINNNPLNLCILYPFAHLALPLVTDYCTTATSYHND